jgi:hypothetical protein
MRCGPCWGVRPGWILQFTLCFKYRLMLSVLSLICCDMIGLDMLRYVMLWYVMLCLCCDMIWCDIISYDMLCYDTIWYAVICCDMLMLWYAMIRYSMLWYDILWYDVICHTKWYDNMHSNTMTTGLLYCTQDYYLSVAHLLFACSPSGRHQLCHYSVRIGRRLKSEGPILTAVHNRETHNPGLRQNHLSVCS